MRLIDAEHLKRWILARWEKTDSRSAYPLRAIDIIDQVDREDTIDAEPVRHGKWNRNNIVYMECSECGWLYEYYLGLEEEWNYCPHCGAKMDEVNDDK